MGPDKIIDFSNARPRGKPISSGTAEGLIPFLRIIDKIAETILPSSTYRHASVLERRTDEEVRKLMEAARDNRPDR